MEYLKEEGKIDIDSRFIDMFRYKESEEEKKESIIPTAQNALLMKQKLTH